MIIITKIHYVRLLNHTANECINDIYTLVNWASTSCSIHLATTRVLASLNTLYGAHLCVNTTHHFTFNPLYCLSESLAPFCKRVTIHKYLRNFIYFVRSTSTNSESVLPHFYVRNGRIVNEQQHQRTRLPVCSLNYSISFIQMGTYKASNAWCVVRVAQETVRCNKKGCRLLCCGGFIMAVRGFSVIRNDGYISGRGQIIFYQVFTFDEAIELLAVTELTRKRLKSTYGGLKVRKGYQVTLSS